MDRKVHQIGSEPISFHSWNANADQLAVTDNNKVDVMKQTGGKWTVTDTLDQHDLRITGIDWAPKNNQIVTCSADRNAYVWTLQDDGRWKHAQVLLRIHRAATCVKWSPEENKFAVGSAARLISVCYYDKENNWWIAKHIKKPIRSTITTVDWHPNNVLLASGSTDFKIRVFSSWVKDIEDKPTATPWGPNMSFQNLMVELANSPKEGGGWIHSVSFSGDGNKLAWVGHDSSVSVVDATNDMTVVKLKTQHLPFLNCIWVNPSTLVVAGHGCVPHTFRLDGAGELVEGEKLEKEAMAKEAKKGGFGALAKFRGADDKGQGQKETVLKTTHQSQITHLRIQQGDKFGAKKISSSGNMGKIVIWDIKC